MKCLKLVYAIFACIVLVGCECPVCQHGGVLGLGCEHDSNYNVCMCFSGYAEGLNCLQILGFSSPPTPTPGTCSVPNLEDGCSTTCSCTVSGQTCACYSTYLGGSCGLASVTTACH